MSFLDSAPQEIISQIFQNCSDFTTVLRLASTCKHAHLIWQSESIVVIWEVGKACIAGFDLALVAVRATNIVLSAHQAGILPPSTSISSLEGTAQKPSLEELKQIFDLRHLVLCIEYFLRLSYDKRDVSASYEEYTLPGVWSENVHIAAYQVFIAGASLSRAYQEPFFAAADEGISDFLGDYSRQLERDRIIDFAGSNCPMSDAEVSFLRRFPVYNFEALEISEDTFAPYANWYLQKCRLRGSNRSEAEVEVEEEMLRDVGRFLFAVSTMGDLNYLFKNEDGMMGYGRPSGKPSRALPVRKTRTTTVVLFGVFCCENIFVPAEIPDVKQSLLVVHQITSKAYRVLDIPTLLSALFKKPGQPNCQNGFPAPNPPLQLLSCLLMRGFNLRFGDDVFSPDKAKDTYWYFGETVEVFDDSKCEQFTQLLCDGDQQIEGSFTESF